mgnify:CR=1 FL=1
MRSGTLNVFVKQSIFGLWIINIIKKQDDVGWNSFQQGLNRRHLSE